MVWQGNGPDDKPVSVAVEYKQIEDVLDCIIDGRFAGHQIIGMLENYDRRYLLVEYGAVRADRNTGIMQRMRKDQRGNPVWFDINRGGRAFMYRDLEHWYATIEEQTQTRVARTRDPYESARWVHAKYTWWTAKGWNDHDALKQFHVPPMPTVGLVKPNFRRRVAKEIPDIGWDRSGPVAKAFRSVREMVNANVQTWARIIVGADKNGHTITIGPNRAAKIVTALTEGGDDGEQGIRGTEQGEEG
jgi:ERCC4-type nuclease